MQMIMFGQLRRPDGIIRISLLLVTLLVFFTIGYLLIQSIGIIHFYKSFEVQDHCMHVSIESIN